MSNKSIKERSTFVLSGVFIIAFSLIFVGKAFSQKSLGDPVTKGKESQSKKDNQDEILKPSEDDSNTYPSYMKPEPTADGYIYDPVGRRDPFRPFRDAKVGVGALVVQRERALEALENFDVKSLEVVAIIWGISRPKALIQDPNKVIHTVVKGMRIGKNDGVVAEIREGEVVVVELFDQNGKVVKEPYIIPIRKL